GRLEEAEAAFRDALRVYRAADSPYGVATALQYLGRVATLAGRIDEAFTLLDDARAEFDGIGAASDGQGGDVILAEAPLPAGDPQQALAIAESHRDAGVMRFAALERVRGQALAALGDDDAARAALESSLEEGRARDALYEIARTLDAIVELDLRAG